jgi:prevent-host-death family protein
MDRDPVPGERLDDLPSVSLTELRESLPDTIGRVAHGKERLLIKRHNRPVAAVVSMDDVRLLEMLDDMLDLEAAAEALEEIANGGDLKSAAEFRKELGL